MCTAAERIKINVFTVHSSDPPCNANQSSTIRTPKTTYNVLHLSCDILLYFVKNNHDPYGLRVHLRVDGWKNLPFCGDVQYNAE